METKLTLSLDKEVIGRAKEYAETKHTSLSKIVENYFYYLTRESEKEEQRNKEKTPITDELEGSLGRLEINEEKEIANYLVGKYINV